MFRKDADGNGESLRTDKNPANEDAMNNLDAPFVTLEGSTLTVDLSGLSFYQASVYYFMIEEEDLDL